MIELIVGQTTRDKCLSNIHIDFIGVIMPGNRCIIVKSSS